ncbi:MAG: DUF6036 family nucleotidyltransferase [Bdellovibrionales bacterium]|nr:DUF6036 family nucleotidyltransferase [Bdellovibrionales bacterium]
MKSMRKEFGKQDILKALQTLDSLAKTPFEVIIAGGSAMICSYKFPLGTTDVDAIIKSADLSKVDTYIKKTAKKLSLSPDWLNIWVSSFTHYLPEDYENRLNVLFKGEQITAKTFGKEDILILKCFAHRGKDIAHARALIKQKADIDFVENHINHLIAKKWPQAKKALDFLYDILDELGL